MSITNELPLWLPWANAIVSVAGMIVAIVVLARWRHRSLTSGLVAAAFVAAQSVLVAGALFQAGLMSIDAWTIVGTGGRMLTLVILLTLLAAPPIDDA